MPILAWSYQVGSGLLSNELQSGVYGCNLTRMGNIPKSRNAFKLKCISKFLLKTYFYIFIFLKIEKIEV
jgi:hypothetical protein